MIKCFGVALLLLCLDCVAICASTVQSNYQCNSRGRISLVLDSINFRHDVTRLYGKLKGQPHVADRIDSIMLQGAMCPAGCASTDIDGVDMKRWFQWEDSGLICVEIDFPPCSNRSGITEIVVNGPKGVSEWQIVKLADGAKTVSE